MAPVDPVHPMRITLLYAPAPRTVRSTELDLPEGASVADACRGSGWWNGRDGLPGPDLHLGIWGRKAEASRTLQPGDRVEVVRGLRVDPKVARRERFAGQGARGAGLFSRRRPGAKPGY